MGACRAWFPPGQSVRRATVGSTREARRAGIQLAMAVTPSRISVTMANTAGSLGDSSNNNGWSHFPAHSMIPAPRHADDAEAKALADHEPHHVSRLGAERHPHSQLVGPLCHIVRDDAVEADRRDDQRQNAEGDEHRRAELPRRPLRAENLGEWGHGDVGAAAGLLGPAASWRRSRRPRSVR